jgi:hypothetical protein
LSERFKSLNLEQRPSCASEANRTSTPSGSIPQSSNYSVNLNRKVEERYGPRKSR